MKEKLKNLKFRKLKISDYEQFRKLFLDCFKMKVSYKFFKWRYFSDKNSFCYAAFDNRKLIANVGMISMKLNNKKKNRVFSRHSSMVDPNFRGLGIFSKLLIHVKKNIKKRVSVIVMWPNKNNHSNFGFKKKHLIIKKFYIYQTKPGIKTLKMKIISIAKLNKLKDYLIQNNSFFLKNFSYFNKRYFLYKKEKYIINQFNYKNFNSFFILKNAENNSDNKYILLDHFGSSEIKMKHFNSLINQKKNIIFLSKKKINHSNFKIINFLNFKLAIMSKSNLEKINILFKNKDFFLGDTDNFMNLN